MMSAAGCLVCHSRLDQASAISHSNMRCCFSETVMVSSQIQVTYVTGQQSSLLVMNHYNDSLFSPTVDYIAK